MTREKAVGENFAAIAGGQRIFAGIRTRIPKAAEFWRDFYAPR